VLTHLHFERSRTRSRHGEKNDGVNPWGCRCRTSACDLESRSRSRRRHADASTARRPDSNPGPGFLDRHRLIVRFLSKIAGLSEHLVDNCFNNAMTTSFPNVAIYPREVLTSDRILTCIGEKNQNGMITMMVGKVTPNANNRF
jgi:hypothetical protein